MTASAKIARSCGTCTMCCKLYEIPELQKPMGSWCKACEPGQGCRAYETRPATCRNFNCLWIMAEFLGPEWKPDKAKFVISIDPKTNHMLIQVDPSLPRAWRNEPYHSQIQQWALSGRATGRHVVIFTGSKGTILLAEGERDLGS